MTYTLYACGTRGTRTVFGNSFLKYGGRTTCYVFKEKDYAFIVDAGSGLDNARTILTDCTQIDIVLTHLHLDHISGLLNTVNFPSNAIVRIYAAFSKWGMENGLQDYPPTPFWPVKMTNYQYININVDKTYQFKDIKLRSYASNHPDDTLMFKIYVNGKLIHFLCDYEHEDENDHKFELHNDMKEPCDLLFYDGTYTPEEYPLYKGHGHSTYEEGIKLAKITGAKKLYITHHEPTRTDDELDALENFAKNSFEDIEFVKNLQIIEI